MDTAPAQLQEAEGHYVFSVVLFLAAIISLIVFALIIFWEHSFINTIDGPVSVKSVQELEDKYLERFKEFSITDINVILFVSVPTVLLLISLLVQKSKNFLKYLILVSIILTIIYLVFISYVNDTNKNAKERYLKNDLEITKIWFEDIKYPGVGTYTYVVKKEKYSYREFSFTVADSEENIRNYYIQRGYKPYCEATNYKDSSFADCERFGWGGWLIRKNATEKTKGVTCDFKISFSQKNNKTLVKSSTCI